MPENLSTSNSKKEIVKNIVKLGCFAVLLVPFIIFLGNLYEQKAGLNKINEWNRQRFEDFYALEENSLDVVFLGSSHSYCTFDPENFDSALGIKSFQLGMPSQHPDMTYYTLREVLNFQKPRAVVMEVYWDFLSKDFEVKQVDATFQFMRNAEMQIEFFKNGFPLNEKIKHLIKPIRYQQDFFAYANKRLADFISEKSGLNRTIIQFVGEEYYLSKGYIYCDYVMTPEAHEKAEKAIETDGRDWKISSVQENYLKKIVELCKENDIELILVTAPVSNISYGKISHYDAIHDKLLRFTDDYGLEYLDFNLVNKEEELFRDHHFRDAGHLNDAGVKIADEYFIEMFRDVLVD